MQFAARDLTASRNANQRAAIALLSGEPPSFTWATSAGGCIFKAIQLTLDMLFISTLSFFMRAHVKPDARLKNAALATVAISSSLNVLVRIQGRK
jgi:hypothetical protein